MRKPELKQRLVVGRARSSARETKSQHTTSVQLGSDAVLTQHADRIAPYAWPALAGTHPDNGTNIPRT